MLLAKNLNRLVYISCLIYIITSISAAYFYYKSESSGYLAEQLISSGISADIANNISEGNLLPIVYVLCDIVRFFSCAALMVISSKIFGFFSKEKMKILLPIIRICLISVSFLCLKNISILSYVFSGTVEGYTPSELNVFSIASLIESNNSGKDFLNLIGIDTIISIIFYCCSIGIDLKGREIFRVVGSGLFIAIIEAGVAFCIGKFS